MLCSLVASDPMFGSDKFKHGALSFVMVSSMSSLARSQGFDQPEIAFGATVSLGLAKEFYDLRVKGHFSFGDLAWDVAGASLGVALVLSTRSNR